MLPEELSMCHVGMSRTSSDDDLPVLAQFRATLSSILKRTNLGRGRA